jgi:kumamolisin
MGFPHPNAIFADTLRVSAAFSFIPMRYRLTCRNVSITRCKVPHVNSSPCSIACIYRLVPHHVPGCDPNVTTHNPSGGSGAIAVVDAFDTPNAAADLAAFSAQFGLPPADFTVVFASGAQPALDPTGGWELEASLDTQWAHAMAPNAKIFLVEAKNNRFSNLFNAVILAANLVAANGGGEVSMSFGGGEFAQETLFDGIFTTPGVV